MPDVSPAILTAWRIGTPAEIVPEKTRDQRAIATFWTTSPIFAGSFSLKTVSYTHLTLPTILRV